MPDHHSGMTTSPIEPTTVTAGDTLIWLRTLSDYPATDGWVLKYRLLNASGKIDVVAAASGTDFLITITNIVSAAYVAGTYDWTSWVEGNSQRITIGTGRIVVKPDPAAQNTFDGRSNARKALEALQTAYQSYITAGNAHIAEYEIAGRKMKFRSSAEILEQISYWQTQVKGEERAERLAKGLKAGNKLHVRF